MVRIVISLQPPCSPPGERMGCAGDAWVSPTLRKLSPPNSAVAVWHGGHSSTARKNARQAGLVLTIPGGKGMGSGRPTRVPDLQSAADLGQSPPCSSLSFPINRPGLTVSIATLAPFGWPSPELEGTPSSSRSPFFRPACEVACRNPSLQQRVIGVPGWREGWTRGGCHRARAAIWQ